MRFLWDLQENGERKGVLKITTSNINSAQCFLLPWWLHPTAGVSNDRGSQLCFPLCVFSCSSPSSMLLLACAWPWCFHLRPLVPSLLCCSLLQSNFLWTRSSPSPASSQLEASPSSLGVFLLSVAASWRRLARWRWGRGGGLWWGSLNCVNVISLQAGCAWAEMNRCMCANTHCLETSTEPRWKDVVRQDVVWDRDTVPKCPSHSRGDLMSRKGIGLFFGVTLTYFLSLTAKPSLIHTLVYLLTLHLTFFFIIFNKCVGKNIYIYIYMDLFFRCRDLM